MNNIERKIQSIIFKKSKWFIIDAEFWLFKHKYKPIKPVDITKNYYRFRIRQPIKGSEYRLIDFGKDSGIKAVYMFIPQKSKEIVGISEFTPEFERSQINKWLSVNQRNLDEYY